MADQSLTILFRGDNKDVLSKLEQERNAVQTTANSIVSANNQIAQSAKLSGDVVFQQLTQFRIGLTQVARGDLGGIPNLIRGFQLAGAEAANLTPKLATAAQATRILDSLFETLGATTITGKTLFADFQSSVKKASSGVGDEAKLLRREFELLGIDLTAAIAKPEKAFRDFLVTIGSGRGKAQAGNILSLGEGQIGLLQRAGQQVVALEKAETAAAASSQVLAGGLSTTTLAVGATALAVVGLVAGLGALAVGFANSANEAQRLADETGLTVDQVRLLQSAGTAANVEFSKISQTFIEFRDNAQKALNDTGEEADKVRKLFSILGVDANKAARDPLAAYEDLIRKLQDVQDVETRAAASKVLLGARSEDLRRLFELLGEDSGALKTELQGLIGTVGDNSRAVSDYNVATAKLDAAWEGFKTTIGSSVLPVLTNLLFLITETAKRAELLADDIQDVWAELTGNGEANVSGGVDFDFGSGSDFGGDEVRDKTRDVKNALRERRRETKAIQDEAAREDLRDLQNQLRTLDAEYALANQRLRQRLAERLITEDDYTRKLEAIAQERQRLALEILQDEETRVNNSKLKPADQTRELTRIANERANLERETAAEIERIQSDARVRQRQAEEQLQQEIFQTLQRANNRKLATIQDYVSNARISVEAGEKAISEIQLSEINQRLARQQEIIASFPTGSEQSRIEVEKLRQIEQEKAAIEEETFRRVRDARLRDLQERRRARQEIEAIQLETARINLDALAAANNVTNDQRAQAIRFNAELERKAIEESTAARLAALQVQLQANEQFIAQDEEQKRQQVENEKLLTELIIAENERRIALLKASKDKEDREVRRTNSTLTDALKTGQQNIKESAKSIIGAFLTGQASARQAAQAFYDQLTAPLVDYLVDEGIAQSVLAIKDLANLNFPGAALHAGAAAALFGGAALIGAGSRAIGGTPSASSGSTSSLTPTQNNQNTLSTEERIRFRESGALSPVTTIVIKHETGMFVEKVESALTSSYRNDGAARKIIDNSTTGRPI